MTRRPDHICWGKEPWFAWDLWNEVPGAPLLLHAMLNGCWAHAPAMVDLTIEGREQSAVLPGVVDLSPVLGDYLPVTSECGLWLGIITGDDTEVTYENENGVEHTASVMPHVDETEYISGGGLGLLWRPWNVVLLQDVDEDSCMDVDETAQWLHVNVTYFEEGDKFDLDNFDLLHGRFREQRKLQRLEWQRFLTAMAPRHTCAELMLADLLEERP